MGSLEAGAMIEKECFATCPRTKCPDFFSCVDHWGDPEEQWGEGHGEDKIN